MSTALLAPLRQLMRSQQPIPLHRVVRVVDSVLAVEHANWAETCVVVVRASRQCPPADRAVADSTVANLCRASSLRLHSMNWRSVSVYTHALTLLNVKQPDLFDRVAVRVKTMAPSPTRTFEVGPETLGYMVRVAKLFAAATDADNVKVTLDAVGLAVVRAPAVLLPQASGDTLVSLTALYRNHPTHEHSKPVINFVAQHLQSSPDLRIQIDTTHLFHLIKHFKALDLPFAPLVQHLLSLVKDFPLTAADGETLSNLAQVARLASSPSETLLNPIADESSGRQLADFSLGEAAVLVNSLSQQRHPRVAETLNQTYKMLQRLGPKALEDVSWPHTQRLFNAFVSNQHPAVELICTAVVQKLPVSPSELCRTVAPRDIVSVASCFGRSRSRDSKRVLHLVADALLLPPFTSGKPVLSWIGLNLLLNAYNEKQHPRGHNVLSVVARIASLLPITQLSDRELLVALLRQSCSIFNRPRLSAVKETPIDTQSFCALLAQFVGRLRQEPTLLHTLTLSNVRNILESLVAVGYVDRDLFTLLAQRVSTARAAQPELHFHRELTSVVHSLAMHDAIAADAPVLQSLLKALAEPIDVKTFNDRRWVLTDLARVAVGAATLDVHDRALWTQLCDKWRTLLKTQRGLTPTHQCQMALVCSHLRTIRLGDVADQLATETQQSRWPSATTDRLVKCTTDTPQPSCLLLPKTVCGGEPLQLNSQRRLAYDPPVPSYTSLNDPTIVLSLVQLRHRILTRAGWTVTEEERKCCDEPQSDGDEAQSVL